MKKLTGLFILFLFSSALFSQGINTEFGQNRVNFQKFNWRYLNSQSIDVFFYDDGDSIAFRVLEIANDDLPNVERFLGYRLSGGIEIMVFNSLSHFRQSYISYQNPQARAGGYSLVSNDRVEVYFDGNYDDLKKQVKEGITRVLLREMMMGSTIQERVQNSVLLELPEWFSAGLASYYAESWNSSLDNQLKDAFASRIIYDFTSLSPEMQKIAGHSIWRFIAEKYGNEVIAGIIYLTRITRSYENGIYFNTKMMLRPFLKEWQEFYKTIYAEDEVGRTFPKGKENLLGKISNIPNTRLKISPDGLNLAIVTNQAGKYSVWLHNNKTKSTNIIYRGGHKVLNQVNDFSYPVISWHPENKHLFVLSDIKGKYALLELNTQGKTIRTYSIKNIEHIIDFTLSPDGNSAILSAINNGRCDLLLYNFKSKEYVALTHDLYTDQSPVFLPNNGYAFVSNRPIKGYDSSAGLNLFYNTFNSNSEPVPLTRFRKEISVRQPALYNDSFITYLCDVSGIMNAWVMPLNKNAKAVPVTNYSVDIIFQDVAPTAGLIAEMVMHRGKYKIFISDLAENPYDQSQNVESKPTWFRKHENKLDSVFLNFKGANIETALVDTFRIKPSDSISESPLTFQTGFPKVDYKAIDKSKKTKNNLLLTNSFPYTRYFSVDYYQSQFDISTLGNYYFTTLLPIESMKSGFFSPMVKISISDLLKNYTLEGTVRILSNFESSDYMVRLRSNRTRLHYDYNLLRRTRYQIFEENLGLKTNTIEAKAGVSYPLNETQRVHATLVGRIDKLHFLASSAKYLSQPDLSNNTAGIQLSYILDNTQSSDQNLLNGTRFKFYLENYNVLNKKGGNITTGFDARFYKKVLRSKALLAVRISGATSAGKYKTGYYVGGVENWLGSKINTQNAMFQPSSYLFQTFVGNLRGFNYNTTSGNSFSLGNFEFRVPMLKLFYHYPVRSELLKYFMIAPFVDAGLSWQGPSPYDASNPFNTQTVFLPQYTISVTSERNPILIGTGIGLRTQLFGYYLKVDYARGFKENTWQKSVVQFSLSQDF